MQSCCRAGGWRQRATAWWLADARPLLACALGSLAAFGLWAGRFRGKGLLLGVLLAPMVVPSIVTALALYMAFARVGLTSSLLGLVLGHTVLAAPYALVAVLAALQGFGPPAAARRRIAGRGAAAGGTSGSGAATAAGHPVGRRIRLRRCRSTILWWRCSWPVPGQYTLPRQMYAGLREFLSPAICAAAVVLTAGSLLPLALVRRRRP